MALKLVSAQPNDPTLADIDLFRNTPPDVVRTLSQSCQWRRYASHQPIVQCHDDDAGQVFFVIGGRVRAVYYSSSGREVIFRDLSAGEMFGELSAIDGQARCASVIAVTDSLVASMTRALFWEILRQHESVSVAILYRLTGLVRKLSERIVELSTLAVRNRIHAELLRLSREAAPDQNMAMIFPAPTHGDIASRVSTHREAVTRELSNLARAGLIKKTNGTLVIHNVAALAQMVKEVLDE